MALIQTGGDRITRVMRWAARIIGAIATAFFLFMIIGSALFDPTPANLGIIIFVIIMIPTITGLLIAWRWEGVGGAIAVLGSLGLGTSVFLEAGHNELLAAVLIPFPFLFAGALFLSCWSRTRLQSVYSVEKGGFQKPFHKA